MEALGRRPAPLRATGVAALALLLAGAHALQLHFLASYPQPELFGDPAGYYRVGVRLLDAFRSWRGGGSLAAAYESVRGTFYLLGVGSLFAGLEALRPGDLAFFRHTFAAFNTLSVPGVFVLARRLSGSGLAGFLAGAAWALHPGFSTQTGRLYPDPITGCLFVWAAALYVEALARRRPVWMTATGLVFGLALLVRSQLLVYMLLVTALVLAGSAAWWARRRESRRLAGALVLGLVPTLAAWAGIVHAVGERDDVIQLGNLTFRPAYLFGFWQFLDTDGWIGPYRLREEPYYRALEAEAESSGNRELLRSRTRQALFTLRYVSGRPLESALMVADNAYRLLDRPANDYKWDYPYPYSVQVGYQRAVVVLAAAGIAVFVAGEPALAGAFLVPLALVVLHGLVFPWPRYNQPAMPILVAAAAAFVVRLAAEAWATGPAPERRHYALAPLGALGAGCALLAGAALLRDAAPEVAAVVRAVGVLSALAAPFLAARRLASASGRRVVTAGFAVVGLLYTAHALRSRLWHEVTTPLEGSTQGAVQEIVLTPEALGRLRTASQAYVMLDLRLPRGDPRHLSLEIGGASVPGSALVATMPRLREATAAGGRDRRGYPQWWAVPLDPAWLPAQATEPFRVTVLSDGSAPAVLKGDRFSGQERSYEGPSFGEWPRAVALKIEYDADYRIPETRALDSARTRSFVLRTGEPDPRPVPWVHRIRLICLSHNVGVVRWESAATPATPAVVLGFAAYTSENTTARLSTNGEPRLDMPMGRSDDFVVGGGGATLCHSALGIRGDKPYARVALRLANPSAGTPVSLEARFLTGMRHESAYFVVDADKWPLSSDDLPDACAPGPGAPWLRGAARLVDATHNNYPDDTGRWEVDRVY